MIFKQHSFIIQIHIMAQKTTFVDYLDHGITVEISETTDGDKNTSVQLIVENTTSPAYITIDLSRADALDLALSILKKLG